MSSTAAEHHDHPAARAPRRLYRTVWRWHFYAGLLCLPFVLWLAATGSIYLFKPQIEAWIDREHNRLRFDAPLASPSAQVQAALAAVPGATFSAYELPATPHSAARVLVRSGSDTIRVYVDPQRLTVRKTVAEDDRLMTVISKLHGQLLIGDIGSYLVELAASWAIVMIITGQYLWWPREASGIRGVLLPRFDRRGRPLWKDLHAVIGFWVSAFALFLLISGLPWTQFWGSSLKAVRQYASATEVRQDWSTGAAKKPAADEHAGHAGHGVAAAASDALDGDALNRAVATVAPLALPPPVLVAPPSRKTPQWTAKSDTQNRPKRVNLTLDGATGAVLKREDFGDRKLLDRIIGTGVAAHEGQLFGWVNQALGAFTALSLIGLTLSGLVMWLKRRPAAVLGAPLALPETRLPRPMIGLAVVLGVLLPIFGLSLIAVLVIERALLRRIAPARSFLGLAPA